MTHRNQRYWDANSPKYPHHVEVLRTVAASTHTLHRVETECGQFLRVPLGEVVMWGFATKEAADKFKAMSF